MKCLSQYRTCFRFLAATFLLLAALQGCSTMRALKQVESAVAEITLPSDQSVTQAADVSFEKPASSDTTISDDVYIMDAVLDEKTGEMVATDVITASKVTARFRNIAERMGRLMLEFDIRVPKEVVRSKWQLRFCPTLMTMGDTLSLEPLLITGKDYREAQLRGYQRYKAFLESIITDTTACIDMGQLEIFLKRNFPSTYAMKTDTTFVSDSMARSYFGLTQRQALEHYTRWWQVSRNERRKEDVPRRYARYVKSPIITDGIRLDTILTDGNELVYRYIQPLQARKGMKRIDVSLKGEIYEFGKGLGEMPRPQNLTFYVSSLTSLADDSVHYLRKVLFRQVSFYNTAMIDFGQGSSELDLALGENANEIDRIRALTQVLEAKEDLVADSIVVVATCSPEGSYKFNERLSSKRSEQITRYMESLEWKGRWESISRCIPENWQGLKQLVQTDSTLSTKAKAEILSLCDSSLDRDKAELSLKRLPEYGYLKGSLYPRLRTVSIEFKMHRKNMAKDTIATTEVDTLYSEGVKALKDLDYKKACEILRPYKDYNAALALACLDYNWTALEILDALRDDSSKVLYLKTLIYSRLEKYDQASKTFVQCLKADPAMAYRANLDPEVSELIKIKRINTQNP